MTHGTVHVFISYSHEDESYRQALQNHLAMLQRAGMIASWHDRCIRPGTGWEGQIHESLHQADIVLLLVSASYLASTYCMDVELAAALERHHRQKARVVPVILHPVEWTDAPFAGLQPLPRDGRPVTGRGWTSVDEALADVARGVRTVVHELRNSRQPTASVVAVPPPAAVRNLQVANDYIEVRIQRPFESYTDEEQRALVDAIGKLQNVTGEVRFVSRHRGSVRIVLAVGAADVPAILAAVRDGALRDHGVEDARVIDFAALLEPGKDPRDVELCDALLGVIGRRATDGGTDAWDQLYRVAVGRARRLLGNRRLPEGMDLEDALADIARAVLEHLMHLEGPPTTAMMQRILEARISSLLRGHQGRGPHRSAGDARETTAIIHSTRILRETTEQTIAALLQQLDSRDREILELRLFLDATFEDIAARLSCSRGVAKLRFFRARQALQALLKNSGNE